GPDPEDGQRIVRLRAFRREAHAGRLHEHAAAWVALDGAEEHAGRLVVRDGALELAIRAEDRVVAVCRVRHDDPAVRLDGDAVGRAELPRAAALLAELPDELALRV